MTPYTAKRMQQTELQVLITIAFWVLPISQS